MVGLCEHLELSVVARQPSKCKSCIKFFWGHLTDDVSYFSLCVINYNFIRLVESWI